VLIVDKQSDPQLMETLSSHGYRVAVVASAFEAIEKGSTQLYDVLFLSSEISGLSTDEAIVLMKECNPKCIIVLTSNTPVDVSNPLVYASLQKPFKIKQVVDLIDRIRAQATSNNPG
jgi:DNA-binding NtrC family response regulator